MERKLKPLAVAQKLQKEGIRLFSPAEFRRLFGVTLRAAQEFIKDHSRDLFFKLRNGLYALGTDPPHELEIANRLYEPSYVSFEYALAHYRMIPEAVYSVTSATTRVTREFQVGGKNYEYAKIKRGTYTGYHLLKVDKAQVLIAVPEKALADYCYFVDLRLKSLNERLRPCNLNARKTFRYARLFERPGVLRLVKEIL